MVAGISHDFESDLAVLVGAVFDGTAELDLRLDGLGEAVVGAQENHQIAVVQRLAKSIVRYGRASYESVRGDARDLRLPHGDGQFERSLLIGGEGDLGIEGVGNEGLAISPRQPRRNLEMNGLGLGGGIAEKDADSGAGTSVAVEANVGDLKIGVGEQGRRDCENETGADQGPPHDGVVRGNGGKIKAAWARAKSFRCGALTEELSLCSFRNRA